MCFSQEPNRESKSNKEVYKKENIVMKAILLNFMEIIHYRTGEERFRESGINIYKTVHVYTVNLSLVVKTG